MERQEQSEDSSWEGNVTSQVKRTWTGAVEETIGMDRLVRHFRGKKYQNSVRVSDEEMKWK